LVGKKQSFAIQPNGNSLKVKITKTSDSKPANGGSTTPLGKNSKKLGSKNFGSDGKEIGEGGVDDKSTEISSNISVTKLEDLPFSKAKSMMSGSTKPSESKDLLPGFMIPSEIEEYIHNNGILNHINLSSSTRKIGTLTVEERRIKIEKYLQKRKKRTWSKKISYDCRKRVADSRLRIKGRFVTKEQAFAMLGSDTGGRELGEITTSEIKNLLNQKFGGLGNKKKDIKDKEKGGMDKKLDDKLDNESSNELE
jgi:CCT motif